MVIIAQYIRRTYNFRHLRLGVVLQSIRRQRKLRVHQLNVIVEHRLLGRRIVLSPLRGKHILLVHQRTAVKEVAQVIQTVVVQTISKKRSVTVLHTHIVAHLGYLRISVIIKAVAIQKERIALIHLHVAERLERTKLIVIVSTIAIHIHAVMTEYHISRHHLRIGMPRIFSQHIRMYQVHLTLGLLLLRSLYFSLLLRARLLVLHRLLS